MECGETDFSSLLDEQRGKPLNMSFVALYWQQMLEAVQAVHEQKVVHSDLKPANFVLVKGRLKIIDFGIAKAIANDTVNIQRDVQVSERSPKKTHAYTVPPDRDSQLHVSRGRPQDEGTVCLQGMLATNVLVRRYAISLRLTSCLTRAMFGRWAASSTR